ncbi:MAG TPA: capsule biosynthesis protein CapB, partial [Myxococcota bacterium]|nr:capsule biosynthesis protein CapB [Myxococcota bacterium]
MTEATPTAVPGQRVFAAPYWGWAPYLPSVEDYLDAATAGVIRIVTPRGVTEVHPPSDLLRRFRAWLSISVRFASFDQLRQASLASLDRSTRNRFVGALQDLGFRTKHIPAGDQTAPPISDLFLSLLAPLAMLVNPYRNTAGELVVVLVVLGIMLMISTWNVRGRVRQDRDAIPLTLGGWGTRGKSGSERMKAAIFEGLGIPFFSKTTGCEAMFLHAVPGARAEEIFLFRPLDMASIWENTQTLSMARRLGARVYLWECMALAGRYVDLLQREWVQDDASTLTNAYPDHEDIQGPTGLDVAESIGNFAPSNALLVTTEEHMVPVVTWAAKARQSKVIHVRHGEGQRLPADLRARLPYREHPRNISMVLALATELGIDPLEALVLIGDHVVPDLGALLALPPVRYDGRRMRFINGHSANDLASFQNCWRMVTPVR